MNEPAIEEHGVVKFLGEGAGKVEALGGVDLAVRQRGSPDHVGEIPKDLYTRNAFVPFSSGSLLGAPVSVGSFLGALLKFGVVAATVEATYVCEAGFDPNKAPNNLLVAVFAFGPLVPESALPSCVAEALQTGRGAAVV
jgi:hypothetical protein